jgi:hypothetical protein
LSTKFEHCENKIGACTPKHYKCFSLQGILLCEGWEFLPISQNVLQLDIIKNGPWLKEAALTSSGIFYFTFVIVSNFYDPWVNKNVKNI